MLTKWRGILVNLLAMLLIAVPCAATVINAAAVPPTRATGDQITATIWNNDALGVYTYINNNIVPLFNLLTTKGDLYVYDGSALTRKGVGADGTVLTADNTQATGIKWASWANTTQLTTKGDLLGYTTTAARIPIGTDAQVLIADSTVAAGLKWGTPAAQVPRGIIISWSPAAAGTNTIPAGWVLCDGLNGTPNLIGKLVLGCQPTGGTAAAASGGYGSQAVDSNGSGATTHTHSVTVSGTTGSTAATVQTSGGTGDVTVATTHTHPFTVTGTTATGSTEPSDYSLVYIMKT